MAGRTARRTPVLTCRFYRAAAGREPVRDWLRSLRAEVRKEVGSDVRQVQWRWPIGKPLVDGFGEGPFEVRTSIEGAAFRVLFCLDGSTMVLLHGFQKKSQRTPKSDLAVARKRQQEVEQES